MRKDVHCCAQQKHSLWPPGADWLCRKSGWRGAPAIAHSRALTLQQLSPAPRPATGVTDCQVALAAHQVRIHTSTGSSVFLDVGSNPVIEHCSAMGFGALTPHQRELLGVPESSAVQTATDASSAAPPGQPDSGSMGDGAMAQPQPTGAAAGAAAGGGSSCWRAVQDFNWLRSTPSPNWWAPRRCLAHGHVRYTTCFQNHNPRS